MGWFFVAATPTFVVFFFRDAIVTAVDCDCYQHFGCFFLSVLPSLFGDLRLLPLVLDFFLVISGYSQQTAETTKMATYGTSHRPTVTLDRQSGGRSSEIEIDASQGHRLLVNSVFFCPQNREQCNVGFRMPW